MFVFFKPGKYFDTNIEELPLALRRYGGDDALETASGNPMSFRDIYRLSSLGLFP